VCRGAQLFFYLGVKERERKVSRLLTWLLCSKANNNFPYFRNLVNFSYDVIYI